MNIVRVSLSFDVLLVLVDSHVVDLHRCGLSVVVVRVPRRVPTVLRVPEIPESKRGFTFYSWKLMSCSVSGLPGGGRRKVGPWFGVGSVRPSVWEEPVGAAHCDVHDDEELSEKHGVSIVAWWEFVAALLLGRREPCRFLQPTGCQFLGSSCRTDPPPTSWPLSALSTTASRPRRGCRVDRNIKTRSIWESGELTWPVYVIPVSVHSQV